MQLRIHESLKPDLEAEVAKVVDAQIASRLGAKDDSIWGPAAEAEASKRLGWIDSPKTSVDLIPEILKLRDHFSRPWCRSYCALWKWAAHRLRQR